MTQLFLRNSLFFSFLCVDIIKELLIAVITEEQEQELFMIDQEPEPSWIHDLNSRNSLTTSTISSRDSLLNFLSTQMKDDPQQVDEEDSYIWVM